MIGEEEKENVNDQGYVRFIRLIERKTNEKICSKTFLVVMFHFETQWINA